MYLKIINALRWRFTVLYHSLLELLFGKFIFGQVYHKHHIYGDKSRLKIAVSAKVSNALFNVASGDIVINDYVFCGHNVLFITGTHDYSKKGLLRQTTIPLFGRDITVQSGVWIGSNSVIIGPCTLGENAVVAANSMVNTDVPPNSIVGGTPAKHIKFIDFSS
jgi:acetyltransferase-like isoleucine patch superfamily enzyme